MRSTNLSTVRVLPAISAKFQALAESYGLNESRLMRSLIDRAVELVPAMRLSQNVVPPAIAHKYWHPTLICALAAMVCSSCTTLSVEDHYSLPDGRDLVQMDFDGGAFIAGVNPTDRFFAVGMLGVPVIPTVVRKSPGPNIEVALRLNETSNHDFDIPQTLCVTPAEGMERCSTKTLIHTYVAYQDNGRAYRDRLKRWQRIPTMCGPGKSYYLELQTPGADRLGRDALYRLCGYSGEPAWDLLEVEIVFEIPCAAECQNSFSVSAAQLVTIGGKPGLVGTLTFRRIRAHDYQPAATIQ